MSTRQSDAVPATGGRTLIDVRIWKIPTLSILSILLAFAFHQCHALAEQNPQVLFEIGVEKLKAGEYQEAVDLFSKVIITTPGNAKALKNRGVALLNLGNLDAAIADFTAAIDLDTGLKGLYSNLGAAFHYKREYEQAIACYDQAIGEDPSRPLGYFNRGLSKLALGRLEDALADFDKTLDLDPEFDEAASARAEVLNRYPAAAEKTPTEAATYSVQTGAFLLEANAIRSRRALAEKGVESTVSVFEGPDGKKWYRVNCGERLDLNGAEQLKKRLKNRYGIESIIRPEN